MKLNTKPLQFQLQFMAEALQSTSLDALRMLVELQDLKLATAKLERYAISSPVPSY